MTQLLYVVTNKKHKLKKHLNNDMPIVKTWLEENKLTLNFKKTKSMLIKAVNSHEFPVSLTDFGNFSRLTAGRHKAHGYL